MRHEVYIILTSIYGPGSFATHLFDVTHFFFFLLHALWIVLAALFIAARGAPKDGIDGIDIDGIEKSDFFSFLPSLSGSEIAREGCVGTARPFTKRFSAMVASFAKNSARRVSRLARSYASSASSSARRAEAGSGVGSAYRSYPRRPRRPSSFEKPPVSCREAEGEGEGPER